MDKKLFIALRKKHNYTQEKLAKELNVSRSTIAMWESGQNEPDNRTIVQIANLLDVSTDELLSNPARIGVKIPVYGEITRDVTLSELQDIVDYEEITEEMASEGEHFGFSVCDDAMEPRISHGDIVIVRTQSDAKSGDTAIVMADGDRAVCRKIKKTHDGITLIALNPAHEPVFYTNSEIDRLPVTVLGRVVELRAKF